MPSSPLHPSIGTSSLGGSSILIYQCLSSSGEDYFLSGTLPVTATGAPLVYVFCLKFYNFKCILMAYMFRCSLCLPPFAFEFSRKLA